MNVSGTEHYEKDRPASLFKKEKENENFKTKIQSKRLKSIFKEPAAAWPILLIFWTTVLFSGRLVHGRREKKKA